MISSTMLARGASWSAPATTRVKVTFGSGASQEFSGSLQRQGERFRHYRLGYSQAYTVEIAIAQDQHEWLPQFRAAPIARIECVSGERSNYVTVVRTSVASTDRATMIVLDALVVVGVTSAG